MIICIQEVRSVGRWSVGRSSLFIKLMSYTPLERSARGVKNANICCKLHQRKLKYHNRCATFLAEPVEPMSERAHFVTAYVDCDQPALRIDSVGLQRPGRRRHNAMMRYNVSVVGL